MHIKKSLFMKEVQGLSKLREPSSNARPFSVPVPVFCSIAHDSLFRLKLVLLRALIVRIELYCILFEITYDPCNLIESRRCDSYTNRTILSSKSHIFPSQ